MLDAGGLDRINTLPKLLDYLRVNCEWPIEEENFEDLVFDWDPKELGLKDAEEYREIEIKQLRPLTSNQQWGIFFVNFPKKDLKVTVLRRILGALTVKRRKSANAGERAAWQKHDLLFLSAYGDSGHRRLTFAHFQDDQDDARGVARLDVLGWNPDNTIRRLSEVRHRLTDNLRWPGPGETIERWRARWSSAFDERPRESIDTSKQLASALAALAVQIRNRAISLLDEETESGPLTKLYKGFKEALIHDLTPHRFADMYAQTITYGLLATTFRRTSGAVTADSISMMALPTNPFLADTLKEFLHAGGRKGAMDFDELGVNDVVEMLRRANMEAVLRDFDDRNPEQDPVIHFYESFLKEYDPEERIQRGVFYTPRPVVSFIVRSVDEALQRDFKLEDGLADTVTWGEMEKRFPNLQRPKGVGASDSFVRILDPATGTGTFLVEVIDLIYERMNTKWSTAGKSKSEIEDLWNDYVPRHLLPRLYAFELMMAPYAIAHMKLGLKLFDTGYKFGSRERARIFLTNALEPAQDLDMQLAFMSEALAREAKAANDAKGRNFTAVIGNPPYAGHSKNNAIPWIVNKVHDYKRGYADLQKAGQAKWLQDDYVKFVRFAEWEIQRSGVGILGFITNNAFLDNPTFKGMRTSLLKEFQLLEIVDLHGSVQKKEKAEGGGVDENVFEIQQSVAISIFTRKTDGSGPIVRRSDLRSSREEKFKKLLENTAGDLPHANVVALAPENILAPLDAGLRGEFRSFPSLPEIMDRNGDPAPGIVTTQDEFAISFDKREQIKKIELFLETRTERQARELYRLCSQNQWNYSDAKQALKTEKWRDEIVPILYRPFDVRVTVYDNHVAVHRRDRVSRHFLSGENLALISVRQVAEGVFSHALVSQSLVESRITTSNKGIGFVFPLWLKPDGTEKRTLPNIEPKFARRIASLVTLEWDDGMGGERQGELAPALRQKKAVQETMFQLPVRCDLGKSFGPRDVFDWVYAVLHSSAYRVRYAELLKSEFARIPLPSSRTLFSQIIQLGKRLVALHLLDEKVEKSLVDPKDYCFAGRGAAIVEKGFPKSNNGRVAINAERWFEEVPENVWLFQICGYQVCEKWLKDRRMDKLGRALNESELLHYRRIVTAISETIDVMAEIDRVIERHGGWPGAFKGMTDAN